MKSNLKPLYCLLSVLLFGVCCGGGGQTAVVAEATFEAEPDGEVDASSSVENEAEVEGVTSSLLSQRTVFVADTSGIVSSVVEITYDTNGKILSEVKTTYSEWDAEPTQYSYAYTYHDGVLAQWEYSDSNSDVPVSDKAMLSYDENGKVVSDAVYEWNYESQSWRTTKVTEYSYADALFSTATASYYEYDAGNVSAESDTTDVYYVTYSYEDNSVTGGKDVLTTNYFKSTGAVVSIGYDLYSCADDTLIYECLVTNGNETRFIGDESCACHATISYAAYDAFNAVGTDFYELDNHGRKMTQRYGVYYLPDDYDDAASFSEYFTSSYFKNLFYDVDFDEEDRWSYQYDPNGAVLKTTVYGDAGGEIAAVHYYHNVYADGTITTTSDADGDGVPTEVDLDDDNAGATFRRDDFCGDGIDNDGNGEIDENKFSYYADADGDGYGDPATEVVLCYNAAESSGYVLNDSDCNDADSEVQIASLYTYYADVDGDGYGDASNSARLCYKSSGYVGYTRADDDDCDDTNAAIYPYAGESCDGVDNDCDGSVDESYSDIDDDHIADCQDVETCDGDDNDGDGQVDEGVTATYYRDDDGDGYGDASTPVEVCTDATGDYVSDATDCDDADAAVHPDANDCGAGYARFPTLYLEGDGGDTDCDGSIDEDRCLGSF